MGADLIALGLTVDMETREAREREAAKALLDALSDEEIQNVLGLADADPFDDRFDDIDEAREFILGGIEEIHSWDEYVARYVEVWDIGMSSRVFYVAGGTSWGDSPFEAWDQVVAVLNLPQASKDRLGIFPGVQP